LGGLPAIAIAYLGEELSRPAMLSAVASYISASSLGGILGRLLAGFFAELGHWPWAFWPLFIASLLLSILVLRYLPRSQHFEAKPFSWRVAAANNWFHLRQPVLLTTFLIGGLNFFIYVNQYTYMSFVLAAEPFNLGSGLIGLLFLTYLTGTLGSALSGRIAQKLPAPIAMALGVVIMMAGSLVTLWQSIPLIILGFFITAFGFFVTHSLASSWVNRHALKAKASASALYLVFYYVGASTGSLYLQPFWQWQKWSGVIVGSCLMLSFTLLLCLSLRRFGR
jgi:YNFM family putative membrane transporter